MSMLNYSEIVENAALCTSLDITKSPQLNERLLIHSLYHHNISAIEPQNKQLINQTNNVECPFR